LNEQAHPHIIFIGQMGSGKTFHGKALSRIVELPFVDLDEEIESIAEMPVAAIFATYGEAHFRALEREALHAQLNQTKPRVIACGGGTPCHYDNMERMNQQGITIYLETPPSLLAERLLAGGLESRPLLKDLPNLESLISYLSQQLTKRKGYYEQAHLSYSQDSNHQDVAKEIAHYLEQIVGH
jgi:shikimate kinase